MDENSVVWNIYDVYSANIVLFSKFSVLLG